MLLRNALRQCSSAMLSGKVSWQWAMAMRHGNKSQQCFVAKPLAMLFGNAVW